MKNIMKAFVWFGEQRAQLTERPIPRLVHPQDALVKVTLSSICTSDLHILHDAVPRANPGIVLGHEFVGEIVSVGNQVKKWKTGDRVAANCITFCGDCYFCRRGFINNCENGGWELGCRIDGCQAEFVRVPYADQGLTKIPETLTDQNALFLGDILSSGYFGAELCEITPGDTVAVIGAGPVGLTAMASAKLFGAGEIIAIDRDPTRLAIAQKQNLCDKVIHSSNQDEIVRAVLDATEQRGSDATIEAAGGEDTFALAWKIARPNSVVALIAMYEQAQSFPLHQMYGKNLIFKTGGVDAVHCERLMKLLASGRLCTDFLIGQTVALNQIEHAYQTFQNRIKTGQTDLFKIAVRPFERSADSPY